MVQQTQNKTNKPTQNKTKGQKERKRSDEKWQQGVHGVLSLKMGSVCLILYIISSINWALNQLSKTLQKMVLFLVTLPFRFYGIDQV